MRPGEPALRMLDNNLHPDVAERPQDRHLARALYAAANNPRGWMERDRQGQ